MEATSIYRTSAHTPRFAFHVAASALNNSELIVVPHNIALAKCCFDFALDFPTIVCVRIHGGVVCLNLPTFGDGNAEMECRLVVKRCWQRLACTCLDVPEGAEGS